MPSFGICEVDNIDTLIQRALRLGQPRLKTIGGNYLNSCASTTASCAEILEEKIENQMHDALLQGQFVLYQPNFAYPTSRIIARKGWCAGYTPPRADAAGPFHPVREERFIISAG